MRAHFALNQNDIDNKFVSANDSDSLLLLLFFYRFTVEKKNTVSK